MSAGAGFTSKLSFSPRVVGVAVLPDEVSLLPETPEFPFVFALLEGEEEYTSRLLRPVFACWASRTLEGLASVVLLRLSCISGRYILTEFLETAALPGALLA